MNISTSKLSSKFQVTVPSWVRESLGGQEHSELVWMEVKPGEIVVMVKKHTKNSLMDLHGKFEDNSWDSLKEIRNDRDNDLILEQR